MGVKPHHAKARPTRTAGSHRDSAGSRGKHQQDDHSGRYRTEGAAQQARHVDGRPGPRRQSTADCRERLNGGRDVDQEHATCRAGSGHPAAGRFPSSQGNPGGGRAHGEQGHDGGAVVLAKRQEGEGHVARQDLTLPKVLKRQLRPGGQPWREPQQPSQNPQQRSNASFRRWRPVRSAAGVSADGIMPGVFQGVPSGCRCRPSGEEVPAILHRMD